MKKVRDKIPSILGSLVLCLGVSVLMGWWFHNPLLIQVFPELSPMQFNTALSFALLGAAVILSDRGRRIPAMILGGIVFLIGAVTAAEHIGNYNFGIDEYFMKAYIVVKTANPGRPSLNTALSLMLAGAALNLNLIRNTKIQIHRAAYYISIFLMANAAWVLVGYLFHIESSSGRDAMTRMAVHSAFGFFVTGTALCLHFSKAEKKSFLFSSVLFFIGILISLEALQILNSSQNEKVINNFRYEAKTVKEEVTEELQRTADSLKFFRAFYEGSNSVEREEFESFVKTGLADWKGLQAIEWAPVVPNQERETFKQSVISEGFPNFDIKELSSSQKNSFQTAAQKTFYAPVLFSEPFASNKAALGYDYASDPLCKETLEKAAGSNRILASPPIPLFRESVDGHLGLLIFNPVYKKSADSKTSPGIENAAGFLIAVLRIYPFIESRNSLMARDAVFIRLVDVTDKEPRALYRSADYPSELQVNGLKGLGYLYEHTFMFSGRKYKIDIIPTEIYLRSQFSALPWVVFLAVFIVAMGGAAFMTNLMDSSQALRAEKEFSEMIQRRLQAVMDSATQVSIISTDPKGLIQVFNSGAEKMLGYKKEEMVGLQTPIRIHLESEVLEYAEKLTAELGRPVQGFEAFVARANRGGFDQRNWTYIRKDGTHLCVNLIVTAVYGRNCEISGYLGIAVDVTEQKRAQQKINALAAIVESSADAILSKDLNGIIKSWNNGAERLYGYSAEEVVGKSVAVLIPPENGDELGELLAKIKKGEFVRQYETVRMRKDGSRVSVSVTISPVFDESGNLSAASVTARDITERKRFEQELREARDAALEASRAKSDFLATMSHEIRTPMNTIIGMSELLEEEHSLTEEQKNFVHRLKLGGEALLGIINDILDLSKIEAGSIELESVPFALREQIENTVELGVLRARQKGLEVNLRIADDFPSHMKGDPTRLRQILLNLLNNAVKFTAKGEILISAAMEQKENKEPFIHIAVTDTGIGISKEALGKLFQPFSQADSSTTRKFGGSGLGLNISKRLVEMMKGKIWVSSEVGAGSTFEFILPYEKPEFACVESSEAGLELKGCRALIVDGHETSGVVLKQYLKGWGVETDRFPDLETAVRKIAEEKQRYDFILMDCQMPGMDGFMTADKGRLAHLSQVPVIMLLTPENRIEDRQRAEKLGFSAYLHKPVTRGFLFKTVQKVLAEKKNLDLKPGFAETKTARPQGDICKILLVDDSEENRDLVKAFLKNQPVEIVTAENGLQAVEWHSRRKFDIILLDMQMPEMDGYTAARTIRAKEEGSHGPKTRIIALTANIFKEDRDKCLAAGCDDYLPKPIKKAVLLGALSQFSVISRKAA